MGQHGQFRTNNEMDKGQPDLKRFRKSRRGGSSRTIVARALSVVFALSGYCDVADRTARSMFVATACDELPVGLLTPLTLTAAPAESAGPTCDAAITDVAWLGMLGIGRGRCSFNPAVAARGSPRSPSWRSCPASLSAAACVPSGPAHRSTPPVYHHRLGFCLLLVLLMAAIPASQRTEKCTFPFESSFQDSVKNSAKNSSGATGALTRRGDAGSDRPMCPSAVVQGPATGWSNPGIGLSGSDATDRRTGDPGAEPTENASQSSSRSKITLAPVPALALARGPPWGSASPSSDSPDDDCNRHITITPHRMAQKKKEKGRKKRASQ